MVSFETWLLRVSLGFFATGLLIGFLFGGKRYASFIAFITVFSLLMLYVIFFQGLPAL